MKLNRKVTGIFIIMIFVIAIIFGITYKKENIGNTIISKNIKEVEEYILNISKYTAIAEFTIEGNKTINKYIVKQEYVKNEYTNQTILEPQNIEGTTIEIQDESLKISNTNLNIKKIYENYESMVDNNLWIDTFVLDYIQNEEAKIFEEEEYFILETISRDGEYYKKLYIENKEYNPVKLEIEDINKKKMLYILYNEITID